MRTGIGVGVVLVTGVLGLLVLARGVEWVVTLGVLAAFTPFHVRMLVGRPGQAS